MLTAICLLYWLCAGIWLAVLIDDAIRRWFR